jgi:hypothetical protein
MVRLSRNGQRLSHPAVRQASQPSEIKRLSLVRRLTFSSLRCQRRVDFLFTPYVAVQSSANVRGRNRPNAGGPASSCCSTSQPAIPSFSSTANRATRQTTSLPSPTPSNPNVPHCSLPLLQPTLTGCRSSSMRSICSRLLPAEFLLPGGLPSLVPPRSTSSEASPPETGGSPNDHFSFP